jgi:hypothetical protein
MRALFAWTPLGHYLGLVRANSLRDNLTVMRELSPCTRSGPQHVALCQNAQVHRMPCDPLMRGPDFAAVQVVSPLEMELTR